MKAIINILILFSLALNSSAQSNLDFEQWTMNYNGIDESKYWLNTSDASQYGAPPTLFKVVESPANGLSSLQLTTAYWQEGADFGLDTLVGSLVQQTPYDKRPKSFEFSYKSFPKLGDEVLIGVQLTMTVNDSMIVIGEGFYSTGQQQEQWANQKIMIEYYSSYPPDNINIIAVSSANAVIKNGSNGHAKIGSSLYLDQFRLNVEETNSPKSTYYIHVFPNPAKSYVNIETNSPEPQLVEIYDLTGKLMHTSSFSGRSNIDISNLPSGTYIYQVSSTISNEITATNKFNIIR